MSMPLNALAVRDGRYTLKLANQLEEIIYMDGLELIAVDHPTDVTVYFNERLLAAPPYPDFVLYPCLNCVLLAMRETATESPSKELTEIDDVWQDDFGPTDIHGMLKNTALRLTWVI